MSPLCGPRSSPAPVKPQRLIIVQSQGWSRIDEKSKSAFEQIIEQARGKQIQIVRREDERAVEALEQAIDGEHVRAILITHCHSDHSPLAAWLRDVSGAPTIAFGPHPRPEPGTEPVEPS